MNIYGGYYTYCEIIEYILPYINLALSNLNKIDSEKVTPENTSQTNWELYGLDELDQVVRQSHEDQIADLQRYSKAWNDMTDQEKADTGLAYTDDDAGANYENLDNRKLYLKLVAELGDENTPGTILYQLKVLRDEIAEIEA